MVVLGGRGEGLVAPPVEGAGAGLRPVGVEGTSVVVFGGRGEGLATPPIEGEGAG